MQQQIKEVLCTKYLTSAKGWAKWLNAKANKVFKDALDREYPNLDNYAEKMYWLVNDLTDYPKCKHCGKPLTVFRYHRSLSGAANTGSRFSYGNYCGSSCAAFSKTTKAKRQETSLCRYGNKYYNNPAKATATCKERYGTGRNNQKVEQTMLLRYGVKSYLGSDEVNSMRNNSEIQHKIQKTKRVNKTFNTSKPEEDYYEYLCSVYGEADVYRQYKDSRYPYNCDFYIKSEDLFIELNLFPSHYVEPFDSANPEHVALLRKCKEYPDNWMDTKMAAVWGETDIEKYECARKNNLKYLRIYEGKEYYEEGSSRQNK